MSVITNTLAMLTARLLVPLFSFGINLGIARILGVEVLGQYVHLAALLVIAQTAAAAGLTPLLTREIATDTDAARRLMGRGRVVGLMTGLLATLGFLLYAALRLPEASWLAALALSLSILPSAWMAVQEASFMARYRHDRITLIAFSEGAIKLGLAGAVFLMGGGLVGLCIVISVARLLGLGVGQLLLNRTGLAGGWKLTLTGLRDFVIDLLPFGAILFLAMLHFRQDVLVIGALRDEEQTGLYGAVAALYALALLLPDSAMSAIYPRLSAAFRRSAEGYREATLLTTKLLAIGSVPISLALIAAAEPLVRLTYGAEFVVAGPTLCILATTLPILAVNAALGQALQAAHLQRAILVVVIVCLVVNLVANLVGVPRVGIAGAAIALLLSSSTGLLLLAMLFHRRVSRLEIQVWPGLAALLLIAAPIAITFSAPAAWRPAVACLALAGFLVGIRAGRLLDRQQLRRAASALRTPPSPVAPGDTDA